MTSRPRARTYTYRCHVQSCSGKTWKLKWSKPGAPPPQTCPHPHPVGAVRPQWMLPVDHPIEPIADWMNPPRPRRRLA